MVKYDIAATKRITVNCVLILSGLLYIYICDMCAISYVSTMCALNIDSHMFIPTLDHVDVLHDGMIE